MAEQTTIEHNGRLYVGGSAAEFAALGAPADVIAAHEAQARRAQIIAECRRRIYAAASVETQLNMAAAAVAASAKTASQRSSDETAMLTAFAAATAWIAAMRGAINTLATDPSANITADSAWPALPPEVAALAAQF